MAIEFDDSNFESEVVNSDTPVVVDFSATWCGPCQQLSPIIDELATEYEGRVKIGKVDIDKAQSTAATSNHLIIQTSSEFQSGQFDPHPVAFGDRDADVLDEVLDEETGLQVSIQDPRCQIGERPRSCSSA